MWLHRCRIADRAHDCAHIDRSGVRPDQGGEDPNPKKIPATDAIVAQLATVNHAAAAAPATVRIAMDAKATVNIGPFARGGTSRAFIHAGDNDVQPQATVTPVGMFLPAFDERFRSGNTAKVTSDGLVDGLAPWRETVRARFAHSTIW
ncbi:MAG: hypothetical protein MI924_07885 [Chloroflexales bacterium]|nr:hypothetical protein [Chloroflexales bacterium]